MTSQKRQVLKRKDESNIKFSWIQTHHARARPTRLDSASECNKKTNDTMENTITEQDQPYKVNFMLEVSVYPKTKDVYARVYPIGQGKKHAIKKKKQAVQARETFVEEPTQVYL